MEEMDVLRRGASETSSTRTRKRRASAITARFQRKALGSDAIPSPQLVAAAGSVLVVQDPTEERQVLMRAARLAGLQVLQAESHEEALQILREVDFPVDLLLVVHQPSLPSSAADLIRESLEIRPGLRVLMMMDSGQREAMRAAYAAGAASIIPRAISAEGFTAFLKQSLSVAREARRQELRRRERRERHASDSPARRGIRRLRFWIDAPIGSRRKRGLASAGMGVAALLIGIGLAFVLERSHRAGDQVEATMNRLLERISRSRGSPPATEAAILYGQNLEQIGLTREANEATRRYHQEHLEELRWQNYSRSSAPAPDHKAPLRQ